MAGAAEDALLLATTSAPRSRCPSSVGTAIAARTPTIRMTTRISVMVKPLSSERRPRERRVMSGHLVGNMTTRRDLSDSPLDLCCRAPHQLRGVELGGEQEDDRHRPREVDRRLLVSRDAEHQLLEVHPQH